MNDIITYRRYRGSDFAALAEIVKITWSYDKLCGEKTAPRLAKTYLYWCLAEQTYMQVAEKNGKPVGIIMGNNFSHHCGKLRFRMRAVLSGLLLRMSKDGRKASAFFDEVDRIYKRLMESGGRKYDGELTFFVMSPDARGKGAGKELFRRFKEYMAGTGARRYYVYTDTSCNYGFYESRGMKLRGSETAMFEREHGSQPFTFFLYDNGEEEGVKCGCDSSL